MTKGEKLARELIALSQRYSDDDFDIASDLLLSGKLFARGIEVARTARSSSAHARAQAHERRGKISQQIDLESLFSDVDEPDRDELILFAKRFKNREIVASNTLVRAFANQIGVDLPKKMPEREVLAKTFVRRLRELPRDLRSVVMRETDRIGTIESSLKRWSDVIVKGEG